MLWMKPILFDLGHCRSVLTGCNFEENTISNVRVQPRDFVKERQGKELFFTSRNLDLIISVDVI